LKRQKRYEKTSSRQVVSDKFMNNETHTTAATERKGMSCFKINLSQKVMGVAHSGVKMSMFRFVIEIALRVE
jgi:hypothetical protein